MREEERDLFQPWVDGHARIFGKPPRIESFAGPRGGPPDLFRIRFPATIEPPELLGGTGHLRGSPALLEHLASLGFDWTETGRIVAAPTPASFNTLLEWMGDNAGLPLVFSVEDATTMSLGPWLSNYMRGYIPLHVASPGYYSMWTPTGGGRSLEGVNWHFVSLAHDLTVHAQNYHRVPRRSLAILSDRIHEALPAEVLAWRRPGAMAPITLTYFYDNDFNRYCYAVWCRCRSVSDFGPLFEAERNFGQLLHALEVRLADTLAGKGYVPSGDSNDMPALTQTEFAVA